MDVINYFIPFIHASFQILLAELNLFVLFYINHYIKMIIIV